MYKEFEKNLYHYDAKRVSRNFNIDGNLNKDPWKNTKFSERFVDLVNGVPCFWDTKIAALWDDLNLYVSFNIEEPNIQAHFKNRDDRVYLENDVEIFIAGDNCYYEFQINALGTVYEVFYIYQKFYIKDSRFNCDEFSLFDRKVDIIGGFQDESRYDMHPNGPAWAFRDWDWPNLQTAVNVDGELNNAKTIDRGWTVEIALPWTGFKSLYGKDFCPKSGDTLRMDFSRFEAVSVNNKKQSGLGWALNKHGVYDSHIPECFSFVHLV